MAFVTRSNSQFRLSGSRFRFIGGNYYPLFYTTSPSTFTTTNLDTFFAQCIKDGVTVLRTWIYNSFQPATNSAGIFAYRSGNSIVYREASFVHADKVLDRARAAGVKLILVFTDWKSAQVNSSNPIVDYLKWNDAINGTTYISGATVTISSLSRVNNVATATTSGAHGFHVGTLLTTAGANESGFNGNPVVTSTANATTFTYASTGSDGDATGTLVASRATNYLQSFYLDSNIQQMFKDYISQWVNRVNTINGITYKNDDTVLAWEIGNELRYDQNNDPNINGSSSINLAKLGGSGGFIDIMSTYIKSIDSNHLVGGTDCAHTTDFVTGDTIHNGTYYGTDFKTTGSLSNIDYFDVHIYPYQGNNVNLQKYGQALGYPNSASMQGLKHQIDKFVQIAHANNKPMVISEWGVIKTNASNDLYTNYPRWMHFQKAMDEFFGSDGDGFIPWHYYGSQDYGTDDNYGIQSQGDYPNSSPFSSMPEFNKTDMPLISYWRRKGKHINGQRGLVD